MMRLVLTVLMLFVSISAYSARFATYRIIVHFGENSPTNINLRLIVRDAGGGLIGTDQDRSFYGVPGTTITRDIGTGAYSTSFSSGTCYELTAQIMSPYQHRDLQRSHPESFGFSLGEADWSTVVLSIEFWVDCVPELVFAAGLSYDQTARIHYRTTATALDLLATNSIAIATASNPFHVEAWLSKATLAGAKINENSRSITWHCVLYDKEREPYRDTAGNVLIFPVVPEWRRSEELYEVAP